MLTCNRTPGAQFWYVFLPFWLLTRSGAQRAAVRIRRPSLYTILFFVGIANLTRTGMAEYAPRANTSMLILAYAACVLLALVTGGLIERLAKDQRTSRGLTGCLGLTGFAFTAINMSSGTALKVQIAAAGIVVLLTVVAEAGYLISARRGGDNGGEQRDVGQHGASDADLPRPEASAGNAAGRAGVVDLSTAATRPGSQGGVRRRRRGRRGGGGDGSDGTNKAA